MKPTELEQPRASRARREGSATTQVIVSQDRADLKALKPFIVLKRAQGDADLVAVLEKLAARDASATGIRHWLIAHRGRSRRPADDPPWGLIMLAVSIRYHRTLTAWERVPAKARAKQIARLARLVEALVRELRTTDVPAIAPAIYLFDPAVLDDAFGEHRRLSLDKDGHTQVNNWWELPLKLRPLLDQQLAPLLEKLAEQLKPGTRHAPAAFRVEAVTHGVAPPASIYRTPRDARPNTGEPDQRVFARHLVGFFKAQYGLVPNGVIADLVNMVMPDAEPLATEESIRDWRGIK
ncbi:MAG: hypothetical protein LKCHEGNO_01619 [Burkholderiaceae bacterium]|nr:hypothetical protein [Burkholderiaceae bacterium]